MTLPEKILGNRHGLGVAVNHDEFGLRVQTADGHVVVAAVDVPGTRRIVGTGDVLIDPRAAVLGNGDLGPGHGAVADIAGVVDVRTVLQALVQQLDHELLRQVGADFLVRGDKDVVCVRAPAARQVGIRRDVDEGRKHCLAIETVQKALAVQSGGRLEGTQHVPAPDRRFLLIERLDFLIQTLELGDDVLMLVQELQRLRDAVAQLLQQTPVALAPRHRSFAVHDLKGTDGVACRWTEHRRCHRALRPVTQLFTDAHKGTLAVREVGVDAGLTVADGLPHQRALGLDDDRSLGDPGPGLKPDALAVPAQHEQPEAIDIEQRRQSGGEQVGDVVVARPCPLLCDGLAFSCCGAEALGGGW